MDTILKNRKTVSSKASLALLTLLLLVWLAAPAQAIIYWSNKDGSADSFDWSNGGSDNGLFGDPNVAGNTFIFFPSNFRAESVNGVADIVSDRMEVTLTAKPGSAITGIRITEYGDYGILSQGLVSASGTMFLTNLSEFEVRHSDFNSDPASPISSGFGSWSAEVAVDNIEWSQLKLVLDNNLMAISMPGSVAFIEKKIMGSAVSVEIIPEPATMVLLGIGSLIIFNGKNKHTK
ncbi:MAG: PEP-CTERM sorting domain-containing protein [Anaerohalosphaeraceae bacterium]|nr:PEP-CTERM sorting domain-containing protein [Anaerohalosphaeraceae bacterium]